MALTDEGMGTTMLVQPSNGGGFGGGLFGGDLSIIVLFFLFMMMGGWGNGFGGGFDGGLYPWMNNSQNINDGFRDQMLGNQINGIQNSITSGFGDVQTALCGGFAGITNTMNQNTMADMERSFAVQSALQNCCCENRAATADLKYTVATEACADRSAISDALRTVIAENTASTQKILDRMCQQEIDALKAQNISLQNQVNLQALAASQTAQTAQLIADNTAQTQYIVNRVAPYPIPAYTVANPVTPA
jgi:hypothetical protein